MNKNNRQFVKNFPKCHVKSELIIWKKIYDVGGYSKVYVGGYSKVCYKQWTTTLKEAAILLLNFLP